MAFLIFRKTSFGSQKIIVFIAVCFSPITSINSPGGFWSINTGSTRKDFSNVSGLKQGMYIFIVFGAGGEILYK
jgi:hypothetical protein